MIEGTVVEVVLSFCSFEEGAFGNFQMAGLLEDVLLEEHLLLHALQHHLALSESIGAVG